MKKITFLIIVVLTCPEWILSQPCLPEGIIITTQNQVDSFQINYPGCTEILGKVIIGSMDGTSDITNLNGLNNLSSIQGSLCFGVYPFIAPQSLASLSGLQNLTSIGGSLKIFDVALTNLSGLDGLTSIGDSLLIDYNSLLTSLTGLNNLISVGGSFFIGQRGNPMFGNPALASLTGLENLTSIGGELFIVNAALTNMTGLENLTFIGGNLIIISNPDLNNLSGLESLTSIGGDLAIGTSEYPMPGLISLTGLDNLTTIGESLWISGNTNLTNLSGLERLTSIGGFLGIIGNDALASLIGLDGITSGSISGLAIRDNKLLSTCNVKIVCDYLVNPKVVLNIQNNASGCDSLYEVKSACGVGVAESNISDGQLFIFPNPSSNKFTVSFTLKQSAQVNLDIRNSIGQVVVTILDESMSEGAHEVTWNAEKLPSGIYFYCLRTGNLSSTGKILLIR